MPVDSLSGSTSAFPVLDILPGAAQEHLASPSIPSVRSVASPQFWMMPQTLPNTIKTLQCTGQSVSAGFHTSNMLPAGFAAASALAAGDVSCPQGHLLESIVTQMEGYSCDRCKRKMLKGAYLWRCRSCNFDVCEECKALAVCPQAHQLSSAITSEANCSCDICRVLQPQGKRVWGCRQCDFDVCDHCKPPVFQCPKGHLLQHWGSSCSATTCQSCAAEFPKGSLMWGCRRCNWDLCERCTPRACPQGHLLERAIAAGDYSCHECRNVVSRGLVKWTCRTCNWDMCSECKSPQASALQELRKQFPTVGIVLLTSVLHRSGGDYDIATATLTKGPPDLRQNPEGWMDFFDDDRDGALSQAEVLEAVAWSFAFGGDQLRRQDASTFLQSIWPSLELDELGRVRYQGLVAHAGLRHRVLHKWSPETFSIARAPASNVPVVVSVSDRPRKSSVPVEVVSVSVGGSPSVFNQGPVSVDQSKGVEQVAVGSTAASAADEVGSTPSKPSLAFYCKLGMGAALKQSSTKPDAAKDAGVSKPAVAVSKPDVAQEVSEYVTENGHEDEATATERARKLLLMSLSRLPENGVLGVYFSAKLSEPFGDFSATLRKRYQTYCNNFLRFAVLAVSADSDVESFKASTQDMSSWDVVPFEDHSRRKSLATLLDVRSVPCLVLVAKDGRTITNNGVAAIGADVDGSRFPWKVPAPESSPLSNYLHGEPREPEKASTEDATDSGRDMPSDAEINPERNRASAPQRSSKLQRGPRAVDDETFADKAETVPLTEESYKQVASFCSNYAMKRFVRRVLDAKWWTVTDDDQFDTLIWEHSGNRGTKTLKALLTDLGSAKWVSPAAHLPGEPPPSRRFRTQSEPQSAVDGRVARVGSKDAGPRRSTVVELPEKPAKSPSNDIGAVGRINDVSTSIVPPGTGPGGTSVRTGPSEGPDGKGSADPKLVKASGGGGASKGSGKSRKGAGKSSVQPGLAEKEDWEALAKVVESPAKEQGSPQYSQVLLRKRIGWRGKSGHCVG
eukprot:TRINITY_DN10306_c0_g1_i1.p1 TRINITY_DN10306_c0_g1~~TRINITY_DN10306_c0_g1_i1.p1  ORF type:complete len:1133 (+),score=132.40 TRINITY_DN10306_c0_g1_i1:350-3400(+)